MNPVLAHSAKSPRQFDTITLDRLENYANFIDIDKSYQGCYTAIHPETCPNDPDLGEEDTVSMQFSASSIPDVIIITPQVFQDQRGDFRETFRKSNFEAAGIDYDFVQDNHASSKKGVLRGLHYQIQQPQGKLMRVVAGEIFDVAVDLRKSSPTFGSAVGVILSQQNNQMLWIPPGFAHGYYVMSDLAEVSYKATDYYAPKWERTLLWNDPDLKIKWPLLSPQHPFLSENDARGIPIRDAEVYQ